MLLGLRELQATRRGVSDKLKSKHIRIDPVSIGLGTLSLDAVGMARPNKVETSHQACLLGSSVSRPRSSGVGVSSMDLGAEVGSSSHACGLKESRHNSKGRISIMPVGSGTSSLVAQPAWTSAKTLGLFMPNAVRVTSQPCPGPKRNLSGNYAPMREWFQVVSPFSPLVLWQLRRISL